jgi:hypothetical protein
MAEIGIVFKCLKKLKKLSLLLNLEADRPNAKIVHLETVSVLIVL